MITVHHLNNSRSQRILWLLEELELPYEIRHYRRDATTNLAPPELKAAHPLGKSPLIDDASVEGGFTLGESGAIIDYIIRRHGHGRLAPAPGTPAHERYLEWLHFAEGSAMLPFMLALYTGRLPAEASAPLQPRIQEQTMAHLQFFADALGGQDWLLDELTGADIAMSFIAEIAAARGAGGAFPTLVAYAKRCQARPAWRRALEKGEAEYAFTLS